MSFKVWACNKKNCCYQILNEKCLIICLRDDKRIVFLFKYTEFQYLLSDTENSFYTPKAMSYLKIVKAFWFN